jgi:ferredoxin
MVVIDLDKCVGCGFCQMVCPREASRVWGYSKIDETRCTDCYGGLHQFEENTPIRDKQEVLDISRTLWTRACIENCPVEALRVKEA